MTNVQAMQDGRLRDLIHDVELLDKLIENLTAGYVNVQPVIQERAELRAQVVERWQELMEEG